ncbi:zinc-dependent alcohol dehydrogenase family protein [Allosediminivita pacifica]|uniref:NADPH:quinone reductase-like Zn-dependent oxidoreductase n=1 Tax=Allosediminivita pacifica TaxID=1267769 RepID=A0A2T6ACK1_9RHOB|nr:zinc-dependent alcohol dehydrogenase family protein [Allosediminivita pacifica]PTX41553.1 NADPH:quinone reductase-like Zn-dependent oxidoreductase [Allosediminivita pacifica]GGB23038.1 NADPH:quinone reductase [Allosediminivita pacifica]
MPRAWQIHGYDGYQGLKLDEVPLEEPGPGELRLRVEAFALNWGDMDLMRDNYSFSFESFPARVGIEAAGIVDAVGPGVEGFELGERVSTMPYFYYGRGASTESLVVEARYVAKAPEGLSAVECASIWMQYLTAYFPQAEITPVGPGDHALVTAGTSTAGAAALEVGRVLGVSTIATTRNPASADYLRAKGADHVIVQGQDDVAARLRDITGGKGVNLVFDPVGVGLISQYSPALARDARIFFYGTLDKEWPELPFVDMFQANATFQPYSVFNYVQDPELCRKGMDFVYDQLAKGTIRPQVDRLFPMEQYIEAWDYLSRPRQSHGKVVIETGL